MSRATLTLRRADDSHRSYIRTLLDRNELPSRDVRSKVDCFYVGYDGADAVGIGGVEVYGTDGLLRSVVVERSVRGDGFGTALCDLLEERASADGVETLYLLTTTAADFFAGRGYVEIERSDAPPAIQQTTEFDGLCPASATCLRKSL
ncbi:arsenic resistance N-acetyltransferase ArsN2 [Haladaptatus sp. NG-WS-4]